jgi:hypothetical protein
MHRKRMYEAEEEEPPGPFYFRADTPEEVTAYEAGLHLHDASVCFMGWRFIL